MKKHLKKLSFLLITLAVLVASFFLLHKTPVTDVDLVNHASADIPSGGGDGDSGTTDSSADGTCGAADGDGDSDCF